MSYTIRTITNDYYLHVIVHGTVEMDADADKMQTDLINLIRSHPQKKQLILLDIRDLEGRASVTNTFFRAATVPDDIKKLRIALLENPKYAERGKISETMYKNSGTIMQMFTDFYKAEEWLSELKLLGYS